MRRNELNQMGEHMRLNTRTVRAGYGDPETWPDCDGHILDPRTPDESQSDLDARADTILARAIIDPCYMADIITARGMTPADYGVWVAQFIARTLDGPADALAMELRAGVRCMLVDALETE